MFPQKILKFESLRLAKMHFRHQKCERRYPVIRYWTLVKYIKKDFGCIAHFLSYIYFQNGHRSLFYHQSCFLFFFCFFGLSIPPKMSVSEIKKKMKFTPVGEGGSGR